MNSIDIGRAHSLGWTKDQILVQKESHANHETDTPHISLMSICLLGVLDNQSKQPRDVPTANG